MFILKANSNVLKMMQDNGRLTGKHV